MLLRQGVDRQGEHFMEILCPPCPCQPRQLAEPKATLRPWHPTKRTTEVPKHPQPSLKSNPLLSLRQYFHGDNSTGSTRLLRVETCIFGNLPLVPRFRAPAPCPPLPGRLTPSPVARGAPDAGWQQRALAASAFLPGPDCRAGGNTSFIRASDHRNAAEVHLTKPKGFSQIRGTQLIFVIWPLYPQRC